MRCAKWFLILAVFPFAALGQAPDVSDGTDAVEEPLEGEGGEDAALLESENLLPQGGFDNNPAEATEPDGWVAESLGDGKWALDRETKLAGAAALRVTPGAAPATVATAEAAITDELRTAAAVVMAKGEGATKAVLRWRGAGQVVREDALRALPPMSNGWRRFVLNEVERPEGAESVAIILTTEPRNGEATWWDTAQITGNFARTAKLGLYYNQVGYTIGAPKFCTAYSNFAPVESSFELVDAMGEVAFSGAAGTPARIADAEGRDWGYYYFRCDFSTFDLPGTYTLRVRLDGKKAEAANIQIDRDLLWQRLMPLMLQQFFFMRAGTDVPNFHTAWHKDDAVDPEDGSALELAGGWYDDGLLSKRDNAGLLWRLAQAYQVAKWRFDEDDNGKAITEELAWGADFVRRLGAREGVCYSGVLAKADYNGAPGRDTDNAPGTGDERKAVRAEDGAAVAAGLAACARLLVDKAPLIEVAGRLLDGAAEGQRTATFFDAAMNLYLATKEERFGTRAQEFFPGVDVNYIESVIAHDDEFGTFSSVELASKTIARADGFLRLARNPFGVCARGGQGRAVYFLGEEGSLDGNSAYILEAAEAVARAYRFSPKPEYTAFVYDQFNWLLGNNPFGVCLVEGAGETRLHTYSSVFLNGGVARGAAPGAIANGIGPKAAGDDRPFLDLREEGTPEARTNGFSLKSNALAISALAHMNRFRYKTQLLR